MSSTVKICGLSTPTTLEAALGAGADMVGFVFFEKSPRYLTLDRARDLGAIARGRAAIVALVVDAPDAILSGIVDALAPDFLQLHGSETPARVAAIRAAFDIAIIKAIGVADADDLTRAAAFADVADGLLIDAKPPRDATRPGGNGAPFEWRLARGFSPGKPWLLSGGLEAGNVAEAIALSGARGVDVSSGVESAPGVKDAARIARFIAEARRALAAAAPSAPGPDWRPLARGLESPLSPR